MADIVGFLIMRGRLNELRTGSIPSLWSGVVTIMPRKEIIVKLEEAD